MTDRLRRAAPSVMPPVSSKGAVKTSAPKKIQKAKVGADGSVTNLTFWVVTAVCHVERMYTSTGFDHESEPHRRLFRARVITSGSVARVISRGGDPGAIGLRR
jgi:hypothetical protein